MAAIMKMQNRYSHNSKDSSSEFDAVSGRWVDTVRVDKRAGYIVTEMAKIPRGLDSLSPLVDHLNHKFKGAGYTYTDIMHVVKRLMEYNVVTHTNGVWKLAPGGKQRWDKIIISLSTDRSGQ